MEPEPKQGRFHASLFFYKIKTVKYIIGIDEVGRGPLAGPVIVAGVLIPEKENLRKYEKRLKTPLKDSKKLSGHQRKIWASFAKENKIRHLISSATSRKIDKINISKAVNLVAGKIIAGLIGNYKIPLSRILILTDAGIKPRSPKFPNLKFTPIVDGDNKIPAISLASIIAKTERDRFMIKLHKKFPLYDFNSNKGYGTKKHLKALKIHGPCSVHRLTFISKYLKIKNAS